VARKARAVLESTSDLQGCGQLTTMSLRCAVGGAAPNHCHRAQEPEHHVRNVRVQSGAAASTRWRSVVSTATSIPAMYRSSHNGLGLASTSKAACGAAQHSVKAFREAAKRGSQRVEVFLDRRGPQHNLDVACGRPPRCKRVSACSLRSLNSDGTLACDPHKLKALVSAWLVAPTDVAADFGIAPLTRARPAAPGAIA